MKSFFSFLILTLFLLGTPTTSHAFSWSDVLQELLPQTTAQELDSDSDGIPDSDDNCPTIANSSQSDADANGIGDVCEDSDVDGILDGADFCPQIPGNGNSTGCPRPQGLAPTQEPFAVLLPAPCDQAPCQVRISFESDLIPLIDCIHGVLTSRDGSLVYHKGPLECLVPKR